jgi:hypothetical protein
MPKNIFKIALLALLSLNLLSCGGGKKGGAPVAFDPSISDCNPLTPFESYNKSSILYNYEITPEPKVIKSKSSSTYLDNTWIIFAKEGAAEDLEIAQMLQEDIENLTSLDLSIVEYSEEDPPEGTNRIFIETKTTNGYARQILNSKGIDLDGFIGCGDEKIGFGEAYILDIDNDIIFYGDEPIGTFYATQTLWWILKGSPFAVLPKLIIADWPDHRIRNHYLPHQFEEKNNELLYRLKVNRFTCYIHPSFFSHPTTENPDAGDLLSRHIAIEEYRKKHYLKFLPMVPPVSLVPSPDAPDATIPYPEILEGWFVEDEPFKIAEGKLTPAINNDHYLSMIKSGSDIFTAWAPGNGVNIYSGGIYTSCKTNWYNVDNSLCHSQNHPCIKVTISKANKEEVDEYQEFNKENKEKKYINYHLTRGLEVGTGKYIEPGLYTLEAYAKAHTDYNKDKCTLGIGVAVSDKEEKDIIRYGVTRAESELASEWKRLIFPFFISKRAPAEQIIISLSTSGYEGCEEAIFYVDDIRIRRISNKLRNVILTDATDVRIFDAETEEKYIEGIDYIVNGKDTPLPNTYTKLSDPFKSQNNPRILEVEWLNNSEIPEEVLVSYDMLITPYRSKNSGTFRHVSMGEPLVYKLFEEKMIQPLFIHSGYNMDEIVLPFDEIRSFNRDSRNWYGYDNKLPNWVLFKNYLGKQTLIINKYNENIPIGVMEMLTLAHNGGNECYLIDRGQWQDNCGETGLGLAGLDKDRYFFMPWTYGAEDSLKLARNAISTMKNLGKKYLPQTGVSRENQQAWNSVIRLSNYPSIGLMGNYYGMDSADFWVDTGNEEKDFETRLNYLKNYAEAAWNFPEEISEIENVWEYCNSLDDDGNGIIDEGFEGKDPAYSSKTTPSLETDPFNCGTCDNNCYKHEGLRGKCVEGACIQE